MGAAILVAGAALLLALLGRGSWLHQMLSTALLVWVGVPAAVVVVVSVVRRWWVAGWLAAGLVCVLVLQLALGLAVLRWDVAWARRDCEGLLGQLDAIHARTGAYPPGGEASLRELLDEPWLRPDLVHYSSDGSSFTLEVRNPAELFGGYTLSHDDRRWREWRD